MPYEYARFAGESIVRREKDSTDDWEEVPPDDFQEAEIEVRIAERMKAESRAHGGQFSINIFRASPES